MITQKNGFVKKKNDERKIKEQGGEWVMFLAENLKTPLSASIAFDWSSDFGLSPNPYTSRKR